MRSTTGSLIRGKAVLHLLQSLDLDADDVVPLYLGDDVTDEDALGRWPDDASASSSATQTIRRWRTGPTAADFVLKSSLR